MSKWRFEIAACAVACAALISMTGCSTVGSAASDLGLAGAGGVAGYQLSGQKVGGAAAGAAVGYLASRVAQSEVQRTVQEAEQRGYDRALNQAVKQQYWIIQNQPDWVEIITWNDLNESTYINPLPNPDQNNQSAVKRFSHAGYLELTKRYISWYKTGQQPDLNNDVLFYFYRTHSTNAVAIDTNDVPVTCFLGDVQDVIYTTVMLTSPANLEIESGSTKTTNSFPAGISNARITFSAGAQKFTLRRNGLQLLTVKGVEIQAQIKNYNYFTASGYAYLPTQLIPPGNLKATGN